MKYCVHCGNQLEDRVVFCTHCGTPQENRRTAPELQETPEEPRRIHEGPEENGKPARKGNFGWAALGFCIPLVGWILYFVWRRTRRAAARAAGIAGLVGWVIWFALSLLMMPAFEGLFSDLFAATINYPELIENFPASSMGQLQLQPGEHYDADADGWLRGDEPGTVYTSDPAVVTVTDRGRITAREEGTAHVVIASSVNGGYFNYRVILCTVAEAPSQPDYAQMIESFVSDTLNTFSLTVGQAHQPGAAIWLGNDMATIYTSDEAVVTVTELGKVTAVGEGSAYVVITSGPDAALFDVYRYDVYGAVPEADLSDLPVISGVDFAAAIENFASTPLNTYALKVGDAVSPTAALWAQNGGRCYTSDANVVTVAKGGTVTAAGPGTAYVVITSGIGNMYEIYKFEVQG